ncbi:MAG: hypothetical protein ACTIKR_01785 [Advenella sp.]|uniref:hypothetical protein n=1 Tax=unclassified Advenella TaxID=2685285 RepID=UPI0018672AF2|nr:hypothetical protein [Advenella sp. FME57]
MHVVPLESLNGTDITRALNDSLKRWVALTRYLGGAPPLMTIVMMPVRPIVPDRKNGLFYTRRNLSRRRFGLIESASETRATAVKMKPE